MPRRTHRQKDYAPHIDAELDLHGYTRHAAQNELRDFFHDATTYEWRRVRIVVGKGTNSPHNQPVLPDVVKAFCNQHGYRYTYAKLAEGGEGALEIRH